MNPTRARRWKRQTGIGPLAPEHGATQIFHKPTGATMTKRSDPAWTALPRNHAQPTPRNIAR